MISDGKKSIKEIFTEERYFEIPDYQRSYAWGEKQLKDFLDDFSHIENSKQYYYGTVLLQQKKSSNDIENDDDTYEIVDGQQRITTLIIFIRCLANRFTELEQTETSYELVNKFIKYKNNYILKLQTQDDGFFKGYILNNNNNFEKRTPAQGNLWNAKVFFTKALENKTVEECSNYKERIKKANCLIYSVNDRAEASMIFETTNDRGKVLSNLEKTKSYLMYKASSVFKNAGSILNTIQQSFNEIYLTYEELKCEKRLNIDENSIQQYMFIAYEEWSDKKDYHGYKTYKPYQNYIDELKDKIDGMVQNIYDGEGNRDEKERQLNDYIEGYIKNLKQSFIAVKQMYRYDGYFKNIITLGKTASIFPILIKAYWIDENVDKSQFNELCHWCEIFCFRGLNILKNASNKFQTKWYSFAKTFDGNFTQLFDEIKKMIISLGNDDKFLERIKSKDFYKDYHPQDRNYLFWSYENYLRAGHRYSELSFEDLWQTDSKKKLTIEHIVAQSNEKEKNRIVKNDKFISIGHRSVFDKEYLHSIGNLTIDPQSANSSKGKKDVEEKVSNYFVKAPLMSQNELPDFIKGKKWTVDSINERRDKIILFIKKIWCFDTTTILNNVSNDNDDENDDELENNQN